MMVLGRMSAGVGLCSQLSQLFTLSSFLHAVVILEEPRSRRQQGWITLLGDNCSSVSCSRLGGTFTCDSCQAGPTTGRSA